MIVFLFVGLGLSFCLFLFGFLSDRPAVIAKISDADGMPMLLALFISFPLVVAVMAGIFGEWQMVKGILVASVPYHIGLAALVIRRLRSLTAHIAETERLSCERETEQLSQARGMTPAALS